MTIDDFLWLPDIVDKLAVKHDVTEQEAEGFSSTGLAIAESNEAIGQAKMCTALGDKRTPVDIWWSSSSANRPTQR